MASPANERDLRLHPGAGRGVRIPSVDYDDGLRRAAAQKLATHRTQLTVAEGDLAARRADLRTHLVSPDYDDSRHQHLLRLVAATERRVERHRACVDHFSALATGKPSAA